MLKLSQCGHRFRVAPGCSSIHIPHLLLTPGALRAIVEEFVIRDGPDLSAVGQRIEQVLRQLDAVFKARSGAEHRKFSCTLLGQSPAQPQEIVVSDATEPYRRQRVVEINTQSGSREALEAQHGQVWTTEELRCDFEVTGFLAPLVVVRRKGDGKKGSLEFQHQPRFYFNFSSHDG